MKLSDQIWTKPNYIREAYCLLSHLGRHKTFAKEREIFLKKNCVKNQEVFEQRFDLLLRIEKKAKEELACYEDLITFYFKTESDSEEGDSVASMALLGIPFLFEKYQKLSEIDTYLDSMSEEERCDLAGDLLKNYQSEVKEDNDPTEIKTPMDVIEYLMRMELSQEEKWKLQTVFIQRKEHQTQVIMLLEQAIKVLKQFDGELLQLTEQFSAHWKTECQGRDFTDYFNEKTQMKLDKNQMGTELIPGILSPRSMGLWVKMERDGGYSERSFFIIGILLDELNMAFISDETRREGYGAYALAVLKLLSDKSKFDILEYIKDEKAYGGELAKQLGLTTATISHHMSVLLKEELINIEKLDTRIYYSSNKKRIEEVLEYCKERLCQ